MAQKVSFNNLLVGDYTEAHVMQLLRSAKHRAEQKNVDFGGLESLYSEIEKQVKNTPHCPCCKREYRVTKGRPGNSSLSIHRVQSSLGYVASNVVAICNGCNKDIGECNNADDIERKMNCLRWQDKKMLDSTRESE